MGLAPDQLRKTNPSLIVASCKGFLKGPYEHRAAMDEVVQMMTGMAYMTGPTGRPLRIGSSANDIMGGLFAAYRVLVALIERQKTGEGAAVRSGLFESCLLLVSQHMVQFDIESEECPPMPEGEFSWPSFAAVAKSLGGDGYTIDSLAALEAASDFINDRNTQILLDLRLDPQTVPRMHK